MRIRHRTRHDEQYEAIGYLVGFGELTCTKYYVVKARGGDDDLALRSQSDYEPVPVEEWEDVTGACQIEQDEFADVGELTILKLEHGRKAIEVQMPVGYRLVPERLWRLSADAQIMLELLRRPDGEPVHALRVERKK